MDARPMYRCPECNGTFAADARELAAACHNKEPESIWECSECVTEYDDQEWAEECCNEDE